MPLQISDDQGLMGLSYLLDAIACHHRESGCYQSIHRYPYETSFLQIRLGLSKRPRCGMRFFKLQKIADV